MVSFGAPAAAAEEAAVEAELEEEAAVDVDGAAEDADDGADAEEAVGEEAVQMSRRNTSFI